MGLPEIRFCYPPAGAAEKRLFLQASEKVRELMFMTRFDWALVDGGDYELFLRRLATISGGESQPLIIPIEVVHGEIVFTIRYRFDGCTQADKERLVQRIVGTGIAPNKNALDPSFRQRCREGEVFGHSVSREAKAREERATFARNLTFYEE